MTTVEWRVVWFPPGQKQAVRQGHTEAYVRAIADEQAEWHPIIECRTITVSDWETVK
jgi:hypothetical protein